MCLYNYNIKIQTSRINATMFAIYGAKAIWKIPPIFKVVSHTFHSSSELGIFRYKDSRIILRARHISFIILKIVLCLNLKFIQIETPEFHLYNKQKFKIF